MTQPPSGWTLTSDLPRNVFWTRIADIGCAVRRRDLVELRVDLAEDALFGDARPLDLDAAVAQDEPPAAVVVRHDEIGLGVVHGAAPRAQKKAVEPARLLAHLVDEAAIGVPPEQPRADRERRRQDLGKTRRQHALLDDHALLEAAGGAQVDGGR